MQRCLQLAALGAGNVAPNPMVGAVLVHQDKIIGEGYHANYGGPHAEVNCINNVSPQHRADISDSTLYVSLEPCNHFGKTPPCTNLILEKRIPRVVMACTDPFEKVNGSGIARLQEAGVQVTTGILKQEAEFLNRRFFTFHHKRRPYIILKWAQTSNQMIAGKGGQPISISHAYTNRLVHRWRSEEAAIMVGTHTVTNDDPSLTTRLWPGKNPWRIVVDRKLALPLSSRVFDPSAPTIVMNEIRSADGQPMLVKYDAAAGMIPSLLDYLYKNGIASVIIEGGTRLLQSFIDAGVWDEARVITNTSMYFEEGILSPNIQGLQPRQSSQQQEDTIDYYFKPHQLPY